LEEFYIKFQKYKFRNAQRYSFYWNKFLTYDVFEFFCDPFTSSNTTLLLTDILKRAEMKIHEKPSNYYREMTSAYPNSLIVREEIHPSADATRCDRPVQALIIHRSVHCSTVWERFVDTAWQYLLNIITIIHRAQPLHQWIIVMRVSEVSSYVRATRPWYALSFPLFGISFMWIELVLASDDFYSNKLIFIMCIHITLLKKRISESASTNRIVYMPM